MIRSNLVCRECSDVFPIQRPTNRVRKENHVKHLWCPRCMEVTEHIEKRDD